MYSHIEVEAEGRTKCRREEMTTNTRVEVGNAMDLWEMRGKVIAVPEINPSGK